MKSSPRFFVFVLFLCTATFSFASSVSVFMCQNDSGTESVRGASIIIENGILESLFDKGYIVSSVVSAKAATDFELALAAAFESCAEGFFDFMVHITVQYTDKIPENPEQIVFSDIQSIDWRVLRVKNKKCIEEKTQIIGAKYEGETDVRALKRIAQELGYTIEKVLRGVH